MAQIKSLDAQGLPESFSLEQHGEKPIVRFSFQERTLRLSYVFPGFSMADHTIDTPGDLSRNVAGFHHEIGISGAGFLSESGKPLLPSFGRFLQIPVGYDYTVRVERAGLQKHGDIHIRPAQENARDQDAWTFEFDQAAYEADQFYPEDPVAISPPLYMDGYRVLCIHVRPMQYNPVRKALHGYSNIEVFIDLAAQDDQNLNGEVAPHVYLGGALNLEAFGNFVFNPQRKFFEKQGLRLPPARQTDPPHGIPAFLIIYGEAFGAPARRLQAWKQKCGLDTDIVPLGEILGTDSSASAREHQVQKLKTYIRHRRGIPGSPLRYVLLFGDINSIPTEERPRPETSSDAHPDTTDHYYFTHRDAVEDECLLPWIAGGRIAAASEAEGLTVVDQIIRYEQNPPDNPDYYRRMTVAAYFEDCDRHGNQDGCADKAYLKTMETVRNHMAAQGFAVNRVYVSNSRSPQKYCDGTPVPPEVKEELIYKTDGAEATAKLIDLINEGQLVIGHRGHGDRLGWLYPPLKTNDLNDVDSPRPSIFFSINCRTGCFDSGRTCFAEKILDLNGGAPSLIASTELSGAWRNDSMIKALFDGIWPGLVHSFPATTNGLPVKYYRIGDIMNYAKAYLILAHGPNANTQKHFEIYHVMGDPTLSIWNSVPTGLGLHTRIREDQLEATLENCPPEAVLSIWCGGDCLLQTTPSGNRLSIPLDALANQPAGDRSDDPLSIYLTAPGHRPVMSQLRLSSPRSAAY